MELNKIRGINEKRESDLNKLGIYDTADLMRYFPRAYIDLRQKKPQSKKIIRDKGHGIMRKRFILQENIKILNMCMSKTEHKTT